MNNNNYNSNNNNNNNSNNNNNNNNTQIAAIALPPSTTHPQLWAELLTFSLNAQKNDRCPESHKACPLSRV